MGWEILLSLDDTNEPNIIKKGMWVDLVIDDTITLNNEALVKLNITFPTIIHNPNILIGEFDKTLSCIDTIFYARPDSVGRYFAFKYLPTRLGNNDIIGRLSIPDLYDDIYFFEDYYVIGD